jgi:hypothetical protein
MNRIAIFSTIAVVALAMSAMSAAQATAPAESATAPAQVSVVVPSTAPARVSVVAPSTAPAQVSVVAPSTAPARVSVVAPSTAPASPGAGKAAPAAGKYAGCIAWLKRAQHEVNSVDGAKDPAQKDYLLGVLLTDYVNVGDIPSARSVFEEISPQQRLFWVGGLIAGMLVQGVDEAEAMKMLAAISDKEIRQIIFRQLASQMVGMEPLVGLQLMRKLPAEDQTLVLGEWVVNLVLAGKLVDARIASQGATGANMKEAVTVLDLAGRVAHGEKTFAEAQAASGKELKEFLPYVMSLNWEKVDKLDPNVAEGVLKATPAGPARAGMEIGMAKNFIKQRRHKSAEAFANAMAADLKQVPVDKIPGPVYLEIAMVMAGVGRFDVAKTMFERAMTDRNQSVSIDRLLNFFETLIEADGGDMADRLAARMPPGLLRQQISRIWAKFFIKQGQPDQVRALLGKVSTPGERAALYIGVAAGLRDLADKPAEPQKP